MHIYLFISRHPMTHYSKSLNETKEQSDFSCYMMWCCKETVHVVSIIIWFCVSHLQRGAHCGLAVSVSAPALKPGHAPVALLHTTLDLGRMGNLAHKMLIIIFPLAFSSAWCSVSGRHCQSKWESQLELQCGAINTSTIRCGCPTIWNWTYMSPSVFLKGRDGWNQEQHIDSR